MSDENVTGEIDLPRFYVKVPAECSAAFAKDMEDQVRSGADLASYIIVTHYRRKAQEKLQRMAQQSSADVVKDVPTFGLGHQKAHDANVEQQNG